MDTEYQKRILTHSKELLKMTNIDVINRFEEICFQLNTSESCDKGFLLDLKLLAKKEILYRIINTQ